MASIGPRRKAEIYEFYRFWRNFDELCQKLPLIFVHGKHNVILCMYRHCTVYIRIQRSLILIHRSQKCNLCTELMNNQGEKIERFKRFRLKSCRSISLPVKDIPSEAPRGHITTGIFSTDKVIRGQCFSPLFGLHPIQTEPLKLIILVLVI